MVRRGLAPTREKARAAIAAGRVTVGGAPADKAARLVAPGDAVRVHGPGPRFVSRGGDKLDAALDRFAIDVGGRRALDAGVSTGGFTDCLLSRGAAAVVAVDVGYGQLDPRLRDDERVDVRERTNVRALTADGIGGTVDIVVADLSFISLRTVMPALMAVACPGGDLVMLVKPQFEAGRVEVGRGHGVVRDPVLWRRVLGEVAGAVEEHGGAMMGCMVSPLRGARGNVEFLLHGAAPGATAASAAVDLDAVVASAASPVSS